MSLFGVVSKQYLEPADMAAVSEAVGESSRHGSSNGPHWGQVEPGSYTSHCLV